MPELLPKFADPVTRLRSTTAPLKPSLTAADVASPLMALAHSLDKGGEAFNAVATEQARQAGEEAGQKARVDDSGNIVMDKTPFLMGPAMPEYRRAATMSMAMRLGPQIDSDVLKMRLAHPEPEEFKAAADQYGERLTSKMDDPHLRMAVTKQFSEAAAHNYRTSLVESDRLNVANKVKDSTDKITRANDRLEAIAFGGGGPAEGREASEEYKSAAGDRMQVYEELRKDPRTRQLYPQERIDNEIKAGFDKETLRSIQGDAVRIFKTRGEKVDAQRYLRDRLMGPEGDKLKLTMTQKLGGVTEGLRMLEMVDAQDKEAQTELNQAVTKHINDTFHDIKTFNEGGHQALMAEAARQGNVKAQNRLETLHDFIQPAQALHNQLPQDQARTFQQIQQGVIPDIASEEFKRKYGSSGASPYLANARSQMFEELDRDPQLKHLLRRVITSEMSGGGSGAQAVLETMADRARMHGYTSFRQAITDGFFGPYNREMAGQAGELKTPGPQESAAIDRVIDRVRGGSHIAELRTEQGSNRQGGPDTGHGERLINIGGEWFSDVKGRSQWSANELERMRAHDEGRPVPELPELQPVVHGPVAPGASSAAPTQQRFNLGATPAAAKMWMMFIESERRNMHAQSQVLYDNMRKQIDQGITPSKEAFDDLISTAQLGGNDKVWEDTKQIAAGLEIANRVRPGQFTTAMSELEAAQRATGDPLVYKMLEEARRRVQKDAEDYKKDPIDFSTRRLGMAPTGDLLANPAGEIASRRKKADTLRELDPEAPKSIDVIAKDGPRVSAMLKEGNPQQASAFLNLLRSGLSDADYVAAMTNENVVEGLKGMSLSNDPLRFVGAMNAMDTMQGVHPQQFDSKYGSALKDLDKWQAMGKPQGGSTPQDAADLQAFINRIHTPLTPAQSRARETELTEIEKERTKWSADDTAYQMSQSWGVPLTQFLGRHLTGSIAAAPPTIPYDSNTGMAFRNEWFDQYKEYRVDGYEENKAREMASKKMNETWGPSTIGGGGFAMAGGPGAVLMKNRPELFYDKIDGSYLWMERDLDEYMTSVLGPKFGEYAPTETPPIQKWKFRALISDATTERERLNPTPGIIDPDTKKPRTSYRIAYDDDKGDTHILVDPNGNSRVRWNPGTFSTDTEPGIGPRGRYEMRKLGEREAATRREHYLDIRRRDIESTMRGP